MGGTVEQWLVACCIHRGQDDEGQTTRNACEASVPRRGSGASSTQLAACVALTPSSQLTTLMHIMSSHHELAP